MARYSECPRNCLGEDCICCPLYLDDKYAHPLSQEEYEEDMQEREESFYDDYDDYDDYEDSMDEDYGYYGSYDDTDTPLGKEYGGDYDSGENY